MKNKTKEIFSLLRRLIINSSFESTNYFKHLYYSRKKFIIDTLIIENGGKYGSRINCA